MTPSSPPSGPLRTHTRGDVEVLHHARDDASFRRRALAREHTPPQEIPRLPADDDILAREPALRGGRELMEDGA